MRKMVVLALLSLVWASATKYAPLERSGPVVGFEFSLDRSSISVGEAAHMKLLAKYANGEVLDVRGSSMVLPSEPETVRILGDRVYGKTPGSVVLRAIFQGREAEAFLEVEK